MDDATATFLLGTSWKMNKTRAEARAWVADVHASGIAARAARTSAGTAPSDGTGTAPAAASDSTPPRLSLFVVPAFTAIESTLDAVREHGVAIAVGAQNVHEAGAGAYTGEVSAAMLADLGCRFVELGHSERRHLYAETDESVAAKVRAVLDHGMRPLICIGDTREERDAGASLDSVLRQARIALSRCTDAERADCRLAYEPVWAIGIGGEAAAPTEVAAVHDSLRERYPDTPLLYGGSVDVDNAAELALLDNVDGLFVGRAALDPNGFVAIAHALADATPVRERHRTGARASDVQP